MSRASAAARRPVFTALLCIASQFLLTLLILKAGRAFAPPEAFGKVKLVAFASTVLLPLLLVQLFGLWSDIGFELRSLKPSPVFWVSLLSGVIFLSMGVHPQEHGSIGGELVMQFVNAFGEELFFRGVIFVLLLGLPRWKAIVLAGVTFGGMHLLHGFMDGNWHAALVQAALTSIAGMMFTAVRYQTGSLWLTLFLHMIVNLCMIYSNLEVVAGPTAIFIVERLANVIQLALVAYAIANDPRADRAQPKAIPA